MNRLEIIIYMILTILLASGLFMLVGGTTKASENPDKTVLKSQIKEQNEVETIITYLTSLGLTTVQANQVIDHTKNVKNPDHFVSWFGAIFRHENGGSFIDGQTNYLAGRLKSGMKYKPFKTQLDGWVGAYNKYWYKHNSVSGRLDYSKYCVSDTHGGGAGCPNWRKNVPYYLGKYGKNIPIGTVATNSNVGYSSIGIYTKAKQKQNEADVLWKQCKESGECKH